MRYSPGMNGTERSPYRDKMAGSLLQELREAQGLSREQLPHAMLVAGVPRDKIPSTKTIYNVERRGQIPRVRIMFGLAQFYGRDVHAIWPVQSRPPLRKRTKPEAATA